MRWQHVVVVGAVIFIIALIGPARAQEVRSTQWLDWTSHNFDLRNTRFAPLDQINTSNVSKLSVKWIFEGQTDAFAQQTPVVVDGVMYFNSGPKIFAIDARTGKTVWTTQMDEVPKTYQVEMGGRGGRGPIYGDGRVYALGQAVLYAVDAKTGKPVESFGHNGQTPFVKRALDLKYPGKYPATVDVVGDLGYRIAGPAIYHDGTLYVGLGSSDDMIRGGLLIAVDGKTGAVKWAFNTIPQGPGDDGWEIAKDTWGSDRGRTGGGIWSQPAIDPELGLIYTSTANPAPDWDGTARPGINLFTNTVLALQLATGKLAWYFQVVHHDLWDLDHMATPVLFDATVDGRTIKGVAAAGKTCYIYIFDRQTGRPINPIVEMPVPTVTDVPGEKPWPTQPIPFTAQGVPQQPFCATYPIIADPELAKRARPAFHPLQLNEFVIISPGIGGGASWGPPSFSPRTGLFYVQGKNDALSLKPKVVGDTLKPGPHFPGNTEAITDRGDKGVTSSTNMTAYNPVTGEQVWRVQLPGTTSSGTLVTAGDVVFQGLGTGDFVAFDARSGQQLFKYTMRRPLATPLTYQVDGRQYVAIVAAGNAIFSFVLP